MLVWSHCQWSSYCSVSDPRTCKYYLAGLFFNSEVDENRSISQLLRACWLFGIASPYFFNYYHIKNARKSEAFTSDLMGFHTAIIWDILRLLASFGQDSGRHTPCMKYFSQVTGSMKSFPVKKHSQNHHSSSCQLEEFSLIVYFLSGRKWKNFFKWKINLFFTYDVVLRRALLSPLSCCYI